MTNLAVDLSDRLADAVERAAPAVVRVDGRRRGPSSGIAFRPEGLIVTADHVLEWDEGIEVTLADGATLPARLVGRDPSTAGGFCCGGLSASTSTASATTSRASHCGVSTGRRPRDAVR